MALSLLAGSTTAFAPTATLVQRPAATNAAAAVRMETVSDLEALAKECNPLLGFYDPLGLAESGKYLGEGYESKVVGFLRHAEIKHGRVAMAAFVGYIVQSNNIYFPWNLQADLPYATVAAAGGPADQWDALPTSAKLQILGFIGLLEALGEKGTPHYMSGGVPGKYPAFADVGVPHFAPSLFDPAGLSKKASPEKKAKGLVAEINNGRLAMIGIMGFVSESKGLIVPGMDSLPIKPYAGEVMAPFSAVDSVLPYVSKMLEYHL